MYIYSIRHVKYQYLHLLIRKFNVKYKINIIEVVPIFLRDFSKIRNKDVHLLSLNTDTRDETYCRKWGLRTVLDEWSHYHHLLLPNTLTDPVLRPWEYFP